MITINDTRSLPEIKRILEQFPEAAGVGVPIGITLLHLADHCGLKKYRRATLAATFMCFEYPDILQTPWIYRFICWLLGLPRVGFGWDLPSDELNLKMYNGCLMISIPILLKEVEEQIIINLFHEH